MGRIIVIVGAALILILGALMILPGLIPSDVYRQRIEAAASETLGRDVTVSGKVRVSVFPRIEARAGLTTIANPEGFGDAPFASMKELRAAVKLWPLIFRRVEIDEFVLVEPSIALVSLENGANNWTFDIGGKPPTPQDPKPSSMAASLGDVRIVDGQVSWDDQAAKRVQNLTGLDLKADMTALDRPFRIRASGRANDLPFELDANIENPKAMIDGAASPVSVKLETDVIATNLEGTLAMGAAPAFDFAFDGQIPSGPALADAFKVQDLPARAVLGRITASGRAFGGPGDITLKIADARHESPLLNADFNGDIRIADFINLQLVANADAPRLAELAAAMNIEAPVAAALGKATATTRISGKFGDLVFSDVDFRHDSGLLGITFAGDATLGADLAYTGRVSITAPDLQQLAAAAGAKLPAGSVYRSFALSGDTSGTTRDVLLRKAIVQFDDIRGEGEAGLTLTGRPRLTGSLSTGLIDATPYATASGAPNDKDAGGWGEEPLDLSPLRLADVDLVIKAAGLKFQKFDFGPSNIAVTLADGVLAADLRQTSLFGGKGGALIVADARTTVSSVVLKANLDGLSLKPFLMAAAGFDMVEGAGDFQIDLTGAGATPQELMSSLAGSGRFDFDNGLVKGVNLAELVRTAQSALATRSIPLNAFGPNAQSRFGALAGAFSMKDGVAAMANLKMDSDVMVVSGGGALDIGRQTLNLSLFPEFKDRNAGVKGYGVPVKLSGGWGGVNISFDYDFLVQRAASDVRAKVSTEIERQLEKQISGDLAGILGLGGKAPAPTSSNGSPGASPTAPVPALPTAPAEPPESTEDRLRREAREALGGILGN
ncbi:MAG: AsmA family protein [Alphaproteobacteria bacterium]|nr:AsmA family protein [Alphaproteobacteria bacterium]